jgi:exonuclease VII large subunit
LEARLSAASPLERLKAGMAYVTDSSGKRIVGVEGLKDGDSIKITMKDGYALANVTKTVIEN